jgi:hypothetical protein
MTTCTVEFSAALHQPERVSETQDWLRSEKNRTLSIRAKRHDGPPEDENTRMVENVKKCHLMVVLFENHDVLKAVDQACKQ